MSGLFDIRELDAFAQELLETAEKKAPKETKKFMKKEGNKLRAETRKIARKKTKKKTGNYLKGIKTGKVYTYSGNGGTAVRVYGGKPAHHAHLIEYGHKDVKGGKLGKGGRVAGYVEGKNVFGEARDKFEGTFYKDVEGFLDEVVKKL